MRNFCFAWTLILCATHVAPAAAQQPKTPVKAATSVDFGRDIQPIFAMRCYPCHSSKVQMNEFRLDRKEDALRGGASGALAIIPGNSPDSLLIKYVSGLDPKIVMPPNGPRLTPEQIALLRTWIDRGAEWSDKPSDASASAKPSGRDHWAFQPRLGPTPPAVKDKSWVRNPIDAFVLAKLEARGWKPSPRAEPRQLLRRVYLDLIGLPPSLAEQEAILKNPSPQALNRVIDDLLSRRGYGERLGRHWLDLVRFAESNGYERDATKQYVWRYRDYVIESFNKDKPFDRFVLEQLGGDELLDVSPKTLIALGYNRLGPWDDEPADRLTDRFDQLDDLVRTTSEVFLGLTLGCARCHNHKFEPLTAQDYYSMVAIFNGLERPRKGRQELDLPIGYPHQIEALAERNRKIEPLEKQIDSLRRGFRARFITSDQSKLSPEVLEAFRLSHGKRSDAQKKLVADHAKQLEEEIFAAVPDSARQQLLELEEKVRDLRQATAELPRGYFMHEPKPIPPATHILIRGNDPGQVPLRSLEVYR